MPITADDVRQSLLANDPEYRHLEDEHSRCESQLEEILRAPYRSSEDLALEVNLKKMKLRLRDRMELIVARHHHSLAHR